MKVLANLNGLILCPFQVILDIVDQINADKTRFSELLLKPIRKLESISDWVALDSLGDPVALRAYEVSHILVSVLAEKGIDSLDLTIYLGDASLEIDNYYALLLLSRLMKGELSVSLYIDNPKKDDLEQYMKESLFNEKLLVRIYSPDDLLQDSTVSKHLNVLKAARYAVLQQRGFDFFDPVTEHINLTHLDFNSSFIKYVWTGLKTGAYPVSTRLLNYVLDNNQLPEQERETLLMHLQHINFLSHQHELVTNQKYPDTFKFQSPEITVNLYFIKAFSATLLKQIDVAEACFRLSGIHVSMPVFDENKLYQLNLLGLFYLLKGEIDVAFAIEKRLNQYLSENKITSIAMNYVVLINIARLYKKSQNFEQSFASYEKAYEHIRKGGFTVFDSMYYNMDKAGIYESTNYHHKALTSWIKVALYWLSSANPFSLALKPRVVLCQEHVSQTLTPLNREKVNQFLFNKINVLSEKLGYKCDPFSSVKLHFISNDIKHKKNTAYITDDMVVYGCALTAEKKTHPPTKTECALHQLLAFLVSKHLLLDIQEGGLIIEEHCEQINSTSVTDYLAVASLQGCSQFYWRGTRYEQNTEALTDLCCSSPA